MTSWNTIPDSWVAPESPGRTSLFTYLRDNLLAAFGGAVGAPALNVGAISVGGFGTDGQALDSTAMTEIGYYDFAGIIWAASRTLPSITIIRSSGDVVISAAVSPNNPTATEMDLAKSMNVQLGNGSVTTSGAGSIGVGGINASGLAGPLGRPFATMNRFWATRCPFVGGPGAVNPGGSLVLIVQGNVTLTGATIDVSGLIGNSPSGAGSIIIVATGNITGGTLKAKGGSSTGGSGGGGGGLISLTAGGSISGQTTDVSGGLSGGGSTGSGGAGSVITQTLSAPDIQAILARL